MVCFCMSWLELTTITEYDAMTPHQQHAIRTKALMYFSLSWALLSARAQGFLLPSVHGRCSEQQSFHYGGYQMIAQCTELQKRGHPPVCTERAQHRKNTKQNALTLGEDWLLTSKGFQHLRSTSKSVATLSNTDVKTKLRYAHIAHSVGLCFLHINKNESK